MGEVRGLFGEVPEPGKPVDSCVGCLRELLQQAEAGELVGLVYGAQTRNGQGQNGMGGVIGGYALVGALELAKAELIALMQDDYE